MNVTDCSIILEILEAEGIACRQRIARLHDLASIAVREAPTAELRTAARLRASELEKAMPCGIHDGGDR